MEKAKNQKISNQEQNQSQNEEDFCYQWDYSDKQELYYGSDNEKEIEVYQKIWTTHSLNPKNNFVSNCQDPSSKSRPVRSIFHNFQKHLVITLRKFIKIKKSTHKNQSEYVADELWSNLVKQTKIYTKNILQFVFGVVDIESTNLTNVYDEQMVQRFGFSYIFSHYSNSKIRQAQQLLRKQVIRQLSDTNVKNLLQARRMRATQEFEEYIKEFISELQQGPMRKRLPKSKKQKMAINKQTRQKMKK